MPQLYDTWVISMHGSKMLFTGEERPQGDAGPAYFQDGPWWSSLANPKFCWKMPK